MVASPLRGLAPLLLLLPRLRLRLPLLLLRRRLRVALLLRRLLLLLLPGLLLLLTLQVRQGWPSQLPRTQLHLLPWSVLHELHLRPRLLRHRQAHAPNHLGLLLLLLLGRPLLWQEQ